MSDMSQRLNNKQQVVAWLSHPISKMFFDNINKEISDLQESLLSGSTLSEGSTATIVSNTAKVIGATGALKFTLDKIINDMKESELND